MTLSEGHKVKFSQVTLSEGQTLREGHNVTLSEGHIRLSQGRCQTLSEGHLTRSQNVTVLEDHT